MSWEIAEIISGGSDDKDSQIVQRVHRVSPRLGSKSPHAHRYHMNSPVWIVPKGVHIIEGLCDGTVAKENDRVCNPDRNYIQERSATEWEAIDFISGKDAQRSSAVSEVIKWTVAEICGVILIIVYKVFLQIDTKKLWFGDVSGIVPGIKVPDTDSVSWLADVIACSLKL
jgi:hypothetical protein